jgi:hypothetical protein
MGQVHAQLGGGGAQHPRALVGAVVDQQAMRQAARQEGVAHQGHEEACTSSRRAKVPPMTAREASSSSTSR